MMSASASLHASVIAVGLIVAILSLTVDIIFRLRLTADEGEIHG